MIKNNNYNMSPKKTIEKKRIIKQSVSSIKNLENRKNSSKFSNKITNSLLTSKNYFKFWEI